MTLTAEHAEARRRGIGGSDAAAICGLSRWRSPMDVYLDKLGMDDGREETEAMYWGTRAEAMIRQRFAEDHPEYLVNGSPDFARHPEHDWMVGSFDGLCFNENGDVVAGWEGKTASAWKREEWDGETVPTEYLLQCQHYMAVSQGSRWYLSVLIGGNDYREWVIERDEELISMLIERESAFWALVESKTPPPIDGSDATTRVLGRLYPAEDAILDPAVSLGDDMEIHAAEVPRLKADLKAMEAELALHENALKAALGENALGYTPEGREVKWSPRAGRATADVKTLLADGMDRYVKQGAGFRVLTVKEG